MVLRATDGAILMELLLTRRPATDGAILGDLFVDGLRQCFTLERAGVEISPGRYRVVITASARFGRMLPLIEGVPGRSGLRIHPLNFPQESDGCIGVGQEATVTSVEHSRLAMAALQPKIAAALARHQDVFITITNAGVEALKA